MDKTDISELITEAHGWALLGMHAEALLLLSSVPREWWGTGPVSAVNLVICAGAGMWETGAEFLEAFTPRSPLEEREAVGRFLLAHAARLLKTGDGEGAKERIARIAEVWPEGRFEVIELLGLKRFFKEA